MDCLACQRPLSDSATACQACGLPVAAHDPLVGKVLGDRYLLRAALGVGGMGVVYRAEHVHMRKEVAVKLLHADLGAASEAGRRFEREAEAASRLDHPNIIQVTDFGRTDDGRLYLVMELLQGEPLTRLIARGPLTPARATVILTQVLRALERAHALGVVHRDLKPDNVFIARRDGDEVVKLLDFGIARMIDPAGSGVREPLTQAGMVFGTPEYLSPEQAIGEIADGRADLYAAGVMLYEMIAGERPFAASSRVAILAKHLTAPVPSLLALRPEAGAAMDRVVGRALEKSRDQRFQTAAQFRAALEAAAGASGGARPWWRVLDGGGEGELVAAARRLFARVRGTLRARFADAVRLAERWNVPRPELAVEAALVAPVVLGVILVVALRSSAPPRPQPPPPALAVSLTRAEDALARGDLPSARAMLQQGFSTHPDVARVHYLLGNLHFAEGDRSQVPAEYHAAISLDGGYKGDATLLANLRTLLDQKPLGASALQLLAEEIGVPALPYLADCAKNCRESALRMGAADAVGKLGSKGLSRSEYADVELQRQVDILENGKTCRDRKAAVAPLRSLGDRRAVEPLRRARDRRGGILGLERMNGCMTREIADAIAALGGQ